MLVPPFVIGFTGHRSGYDEALIAPVLMEVLIDLQSRIRSAGGEAVLYASIAEGSDTLFVEIARDLGLPVHLILPLEEEEFAKDFSSPAAWERAKAQIDRVRAKPDRETLRLTKGDSSRPACYYDQGMQMLEACDVVVALWNGEAARGSGGTGQIVAQARAMEIAVVVVDSKDGTVTRPESLDESFAPDPVLTDLNEIAVASEKVETDFARDPASYQHCLDTIAIREARGFRPSLMVIILFYGLSALIGGIATFIAPDDHWFTEYLWVVLAGELVLLLAAMVMNYRLNHRSVQTNWIQCRFACELFRGLRVSVPLVDPLHPLITDRLPDWRRFTLAAGLLALRGNEAKDIIQRRDQYLETRLGDTHPDSQVLHYRTKQPKAPLWWRWVSFTGEASVYLAPLSVALAMANALLDLGWDTHFVPWILVTLLPMYLPVFAGIAGGVAQTLDVNRRGERYPRVLERLLTIRQWMAGLETEASLERAVARTETILQEELAEWQTAMSNTSAE